MSKPILLWFRVIKSKFCDILFTGNIDYQLENIDKNFILKISFS